jgi:hypothetical protein
MESVGSFGRVVEEPGRQQAYLDNLEPGVYPGDEYRVLAGLPCRGRAGLCLRAYRASLQQDVKKGDMYDFTTTLRHQNL